MALIQDDYGAARDLFTSSLEQFRQLGDRPGEAAALSGLTDMDAITLSTSRMAAGGGLEAALAWRAIAIASVANLVFKNAMVAVLGEGRLARRLAALFGIEVLATAALMIAWPDSGPVHGR